MALSADTKRRLTVATASTSAGNELSGTLDGLVDGSLKTLSSPTTLYVETTGNDLNPGTQTQPLKSVQAALDSLRGMTIDAALTIQLGLGQFDGFIIPSDFVFATNGALEIKGTVVQVAEVTPTSGAPNGQLICNTVDLTTIPNGTFISAKPGDPYLYGTVVDHSGTTTISTTSAYTYSVGVPVQFYTLGTEILVNQNEPLLGSALVAVSNRRMDQGMIGYQLFLTNLKINASASNTRALLLGAGAIGLRGLDLSVSGSTGANYLASDTYSFGGVTRIGGTSRTVWTAYPHRSAGLFATLVNAIGTGSSGTAAFLSTAQIDAVVTASVSGAIRDVPYPFTLGTLIGTSTNCNMARVSVSCSFTGATAAIVADNRTNNVIVSSPSTGYFFAPSNTLFISLNKGGSAHIYSTTGSDNSATEISVDGATSTLAAMRALTPKAFPATPNVYGSIAYE